MPSTNQFAQIFGIAPNITGLGADVAAAHADAAIDVVDWPGAATDAGGPALARDPFDPDHA